MSNDRRPAAMLRSVVICQFFALLLALLPAAGHLWWQVSTLDGDNTGNPLERFRSNRTAGVLMALACFTVGNA